MEAAARHIMKRGESIEQLSAKYGVPVCMIMRANNLLPTDGIKAGDSIVIPPPDFCRAGAFTHTVKNGESLISLSEEYGVTAHAILAINPLLESYSIHPGMRLFIPPRGRVYTASAADTLALIAEKLSVSAESLSQKNGGITEVYPGMQLYIPEE